AGAQQHGAAHALAQQAQLSFGGLGGNPRFGEQAKVGIGQEMRGDFFRGHALSGKTVSAVASPASVRAVSTPATRRRARFSLQFSPSATATWNRNQATRKRRRVSAATTSASAATTASAGIFAARPENEGFQRAMGRNVENSGEKGECSPEAKRSWRVAGGGKQAMHAGRHSGRQPFAACHPRGRSLAKESS